MKIKEKTTYITEDGKEFPVKELAEKHQEFLDSIDYKEEYFNMAKKIERLESEIEILKSQLSWTRPFADIRANSPQQYPNPGQGTTPYTFLNGGK